MADPTPMDVDDEAAPTDLVLPDVMEGMLRMAALTTPDTLQDAAKSWTEPQATTRSSSRPRTTSTTNYS